MTFGITVKKASQKVVEGCYLKNDVMGSWLSVKLGWDTVGKCVLFGATGVIGSKDVEFFVVRKVEKRCATCALSGCRSSTGTTWWEIGNFRLYAPPLKSCDQ